MYRKLIFSLCMLLFSASLALAEESGPSAANGPSVPDGPPAATEAADAAAKAVKGMSVLGNNEAPMSLFIVPWESSELGVEANLSRSLNEHDLPVDRDVFMRELDFYQVSVAGTGAVATAAVTRILK